MTRVIGGGYAYDGLRNTARRMSIDQAISDRLTGPTLRRAIARALQAEQLSCSEIAEEFGCSLRLVKYVAAAMNRECADAE